MRFLRTTALRGAAALCAMGLIAALGGCARATDSSVTTLNFFQFKGEALNVFNDVIAEFEAKNPDIKVVQNQVADADTTIRTLLVKDRTPDVITLNAGANFGGLAEAGVFHDFTGDPLVGEINPAVQEILADLGNKKGEINSLGYINNANGIIYNTKIFADQGLQVPTTWAELVDVCDKLKAAGVTPFYGTLADSWTTMPSFNGLGGYAAKDDFFDKMRAEGVNVGPNSPVSFEKNFATALEQQQKLFSYAQDGYRGRTYDDGNAAFARGEVAMLMQGIWALSPIKDINPDIQASIFPYPPPEGGADDRVLVSGVDVTVTIGRNTPHKEQALRFVHFLFEKSIIEKVAASQNMIPSLKGAQLSSEPALQAVKPYFDQGRITGFVDHQIPPSIPLAATIQQALFDGNSAAALATLDNEWRKVAARTIPTSGE